MSGHPPLKAAELFAGVGGFRLGLERSGLWHVAWSNQWEPPGSEVRQFASRCYVAHFGPEGHSNEDIARVLDEVEAGTRSLPRFDMVVGGFPCQDYSVAKPLNQAHGIEGKKGVLWWEIHRLLRLLQKKRRAPRYLLLENVDRLLKSPGKQRGRDFAIVLASLSDLGYDVEWRVINAADYGFPQRRRRVFIVAVRRSRARGRPTTLGKHTVLTNGVLARAFPCREVGEKALDLGPELRLEGDVHEISRTFGRGAERSMFRSAGYVSERKVWTLDVDPVHGGPRANLSDILVPHDSVSDTYSVPVRQVSKWRYLKGAKNEPRLHKASGARYVYTEGALPFPDPVDRPARTILTGEGGSSPSRFKHVISTENGRFRRLTPVELERLNGFPDGWTDTGMSEVQRAFCMGNALVVGLVERIARELGAVTSD